MGTFYRFCFLAAFVVCSRGTWSQAADPTKARSKTPAPAKASATEQAAKPDFDKVGPQVGDQLPDLDLLTLKGEPQRLGAAWHSGPALLVTSSLTCPKSRSRWPELAAIQKKYGDKLNVVIVYVIEAHPVGSVCPYKGVEDITPENERDGILRRQPTTIEDRVELAQEFKRFLRIDAPIYIDNLKNDAWHAVGAAPNLALLVDKEGIVAARQGWFEGVKLQEAIDTYLTTLDKQKVDRELQYQQSSKDRDQRDRLSLRSYEVRKLLETDDTEALTRFLKESPLAANYVVPGQQGHNEETTLLMEAVDAGNLAAVELLLASGADLSASTRSYSSALQLAAELGDLPIATFLLKRGADPNLPPTGQTPTHEAALHGKREVLDALLAAGAKSDLFTNVALGNLEAVRKVIAADPARAGLADGEQRTPLDYAAATGQLDVAQLLLESGAPIVTQRRVWVEPPLHRAIERKDAAMVELLLKAGSSPNTSVGSGGESPTSMPALHAAIMKEDLAIVKLLLAAKADLGVRNTYSETPLHSAAESGNVEIVAALLKAGADVHAKQLGFDLPCGSGDEEIPSNNTPLHFAAARGNPATIRLLLEAGAGIDAINADDATPLIVTVDHLKHVGIDESRRLKNATYLVAAGANVNARRQSQSVLDLASGHTEKQDLSELIAVLKKAGAKSARQAAKEKPVTRSPRSF